MEYVTKGRVLCKTVVVSVDNADQDQITFCRQCSQRSDFLKHASKLRSTLYSTLFNP